MDDKVTVKELQDELDKIKKSIFINTKLLKLAVEKVLRSSAKDLSFNLNLLEVALIQSKEDEPSSEEIQAILKNPTI